MDQTLRLLFDAAESHAKAGSYRELAATLGELSMLDETGRLIWAAQAAWLSATRADIPPAEARSHFENLFEAASGHAPLQRLLTARLLWLAMPGGGEADNPDAAINATWVARKTAEAHGVVTQEEFSEWMYALLSANREELAKEFDESLVALAGDRPWVFDRELAAKVD
jgi:hypothetical protein